MFSKVESFLEGKKTYFVALCVAAVAGSLYLGYIDQDVANQLYILLGATGLATLRAGVSK